MSLRWKPVHGRSDSAPMPNAILKRNCLLAQTITRDSIPRRPNVAFNSVSLDRNGQMLLKPYDSGTNHSSVHGCIHREFQKHLPVLVYGTKNTRLYLSSVFY